MPHFFVVGRIEIYFVVYPSQTFERSHSSPYVSHSVDNSHTAFVVDVLGRSRGITQARRCIKSSLNFTSVKSATDGCSAATVREKPSAEQWKRYFVVDVLGRLFVKPNEIQRSSLKFFSALVATFKRHFGGSAQHVFYKNVIYDAVPSARRMG